MPAKQKIQTCLWFDTKAEEAAKHYVSIFKNSKILNVTHYGDAGPRPKGMVMTVEFELEGHSFIALNGGPNFKFNEAISLSVDCDSQEEVDALWSKLTAEGGEDGPCGWVKDKFGLSWQIVPSEFVKLVQDPDPKKSQRAMAAMLKMRKLDIAQLRAAVEKE